MEGVLNREIILNKAVCRIITVITFVILTSLGAFVRIPLPFSPVPITLQTFFVLLSGAFLGSLGTLTQMIYVLLGVSGLPLFAGAGSGWLYLFGPTGGYLFGFILATLFLNRLMKYNPHNFISIFFIFSIADLLLLISGTFWLKITLGSSFSKSLMMGFLPFIPGDLLKILAATSLFIKINPRLKEIFS